MANYYGTTASNGGKIKKGMEKELQAYLDLWGFTGDGDMHTEIRGGFLHVYGYEDFDPRLLITKEQAEANEDYEEGEFNDDADSDPEAFLEGLAPFLEVQGEDKAQNLIVIHTVGGEKCRFPLGACEMVLRPDGFVESNSFKFWS